MASVRDDPRELRYELLDDSGVMIGEIRYALEPGAVALVHTEVDPKFRGQGLADELVQGALNDLRERGLKMIPVCPYVRAWLRRHPDQADLAVEPLKGLRSSASEKRDVSDHQPGDHKHEHESPLLHAQEHQGYGEDEGERERLLEDDDSPDESD
jgi:predicted GNAT family acetyltransferase